MPTSTPDLDLDLGYLPEGEWVARLDALGDDHGFFERLGERHLSLFVESGPSLLVSFDTVSGSRRAPNGLPRALDQVTRNNWSVLTVLSRGETWYRDPAVWRHFDRLTDDGFFEDFRAVLFTGAGPGGYAAAAYSVAAPGARVMAMRPYATLDPAIAGWDRRHLGQRRLDWSSRYGFAPGMIDAARQVWVVHDPLHVPDAMHAALFHRPNVTLLRCRMTGMRVDAMLEGIHATPRLLDLAMDGSLDARGFARLWRGRRRHGPYLRNLLKRLETMGRDDLALRLCRFGLGTVDRPLYARKLAELGGAPARRAAG
ncbi:hypothetical protein Rumeso_00870 [Rubellimicrobium mesophilum DSM 19309]|uniref:Phosphoadenosine phosphosulfate reductase n=1 Tax=Rubellimicrobium mesophilum DSM 19309 TaxID=442562 RepID=A0A017HVC3_9RHOB|nr:hypothetical protein [Rubellimicrobium mesophilum]EYD77704.1 hypothetical protein Rumeso_00870 [Rubellimicrobium mesophilum DSM 19309]